MLAWRMNLPASERREENEDESKEHESETRERFLSEGPLGPRQGSISNVLAETRSVVPRRDGKRRIPIKRSLG